MVSVLARKARRDIRRQRWQYLSVAITVFLGVVLFAASYDAFLNLERSYQHTYERLSFADLTITGGDAESIAADLGTVDGVAAVTTRRQADVGVRVNGDHTLLGRVVELPISGQPLVNQLAVLAGTWPSAGDGDSVLMERHMSDHFDLGPGATVEVRSPSGWRIVNVAASVASAEYIWPARSRQDLLTSPDDFGVLFATSTLFNEIAAQPTNQVLVTFSPDAASDQLTAELTTRAIADGASSVQPLADQPSNAALQEDVSGFGELSFLFPVLFLGAATMATFILLGRVVRAQEAQVATLTANGMAPRRIVMHYLTMGMTISGVAGLTGLVVGILAGRFVTGLYTDAINVPDTITGFHLTTIVTGVVLSLATGAIAAAAPAIAAGRAQPAAALGGVTPPGSGSRSLLERLVPALSRLPARWRMVLRGIGREPRRSLSTAAGVVLALILILASWGMVDTVDILLQRQFDDIQRQDAQVEIDRADGDTVGAIGGLDGVARAEPVATAGVVVSVGDRRYATELMAFDSETKMHDFGTGLPDAGLVAGRSLGPLLDITTGDAVTITRTDRPVSIELPVVEFVDEPLGTMVYAQTGTVESLTASSATKSVLVSFTDGADREVMRQRIAALPGVVAYVDSRSLYDTAQSLLSLFYAFVGVMLAFGALMAFALLFNTTTVNTSERSPELAAMKVNGASTGQLAMLVAGENLLLAALSIIPGLAVGYWVSAVFMNSFSSDLFDFGLQIRVRTLILSAAAVLAVSALAQWPASRTIASLDVARVVRERSQ